MAAEDKHKNKYNIKILGEELVVVGDISDDYVQKLAAYINSIGQEINNAYPRLPRQRILSLIIVNLADDYFKLSQRCKKKNQDIEMLEGEYKKLREKFTKLRKEHQELLTMLEEVE